MKNNNTYNELEKALEEAGIDFDGYTDGDNCSYMIEGSTYLIDCYLDFENDLYSLETKHRGFDEDKTWGNKREYKKLSSLAKNVLIWADK